MHIRPTPFDLDPTASWTVFVLRPTEDCSNNGVTSRVTMFTLLGPDAKVPARAAQHPDEYLRLVYRDNWMNDLIAIPLPASTPPNSTHCGPMFGGNYVYSSDSRLPCGPIRVHDRFDTWENHAILST